MENGSTLLDLNFVAVTVGMISRFIPGGAITKKVWEVREKRFGLTVSSNFNVIHSKYWRES